jgi:hypothetical protein
MSVARLHNDEQLARHWSREVSKAAANYERRWTWAALKRVDPDIATRLSTQRDLFGRAAVTGTGDEVEVHAAALCRGYAAAVKALEAADEPDDAYLLGRDPRSGFTVAVGHQKAAADRVAELHGQFVVWVSPDELAALLAQLQGLDALWTVKRTFPGAEVIDIRQGKASRLHPEMEDTN